MREEDKRERGEETKERKRRGEEKGERKKKKKGVKF